jgi:hypothetical protein
MTPSSPAPSNRVNQSAATSASRVAGERWTGGAHVGQRRFERATSLDHRGAGQVVLAEREEVEGDVPGGCAPGQHLDPGGGGMDALAQRVEVEDPVAGDHQLAVHHATRGQQLTQRALQLGEVAVEGLAVAALHEQLVAVPEDDAAEAVPLGLVEHLAARQLPGELGEHGLDRGGDGKLQRRAFRALRTACHDLVAHVRATTSGRGAPIVAATTSPAGGARCDCTTSH